MKDEEKKTAERFNIEDDAFLQYVPRRQRYRMYGADAVRAAKCGRSEAPCGFVFNTYAFPC